MKGLPTSLISNGFRISGFYLIALFLYFSPTSTAQGVTIGSNTPADPSATLEVKSTTGGLLLPRLSTAQRNAILSPSPGLMIYNSSNECMEVYHASGWKAFSCSCSAPPPAPQSILGPTQVCAQQTAVQYHVAPVPGASTYTWSATGGATVQSGQGDTLITVDFSSGPGTLSVVASNYCGTASALSINYLAANPNPGFTVNPAQPITNQAATFTANSQGLQYAWTFQNGTPNTSSSANPSVTYSATGSNSVKLVVADQNGCTDSSTQSVTVTNCPAPGQNQVAFSYTGGQQSWTVPATCVSSVTLECWGAQGGNSGAAGGYAKGDLSVSPGQVLYLYVGGQGGNPSGGWNGGGTGHSSMTTSGGGGGGTDVRLGGTTLNDRIIVAGGGGGRCSLFSGNFNFTNAGEGGGLSGNSGGNVNNGGAFAFGGSGGTSNNGGQGGGSSPASGSGTAGTFGQGGNGFPGSDATAGGGGGGYYGGGGGGYQSVGTNIAASGGGGSGYTGNLSNASMQTGIRNGNGQIVITY